MPTRKRYSPRPRFTVEILGENKTRLIVGVASEWWLFRLLRMVSADGGQISRLEVEARPLTDRSLAGLNCYLKSRSIRFWKSRRWDDGKELIGWGEWCRFCKMLGLTFDGKNSGRLAA